MNVEAKLAAKMGKTVILPAALAYQRELAEGVAALKAAGVTPDTALLTQVTKLIGDLQTGLTGLESASAHHGGSVMDEAKGFCNTVLPAMLKLREAADALEGVVDDALWPLPTYQEMLFIR